MCVEIICCHIVEAWPKPYRMLWHTSDSHVIEVSKLDKSPLPVRPSFENSPEQTGKSWTEEEQYWHSFSVVFPNATDSSWQNVVPHYGLEAFCHPRYWSPRLFVSYVTVWYHFIADAINISHPEFSPSHSGDSPLLSLLKVSLSFSLSYFLSYFLSIAFSLFFLPGLIHSSNLARLSPCSSIGSDSDFFLILIPLYNHTILLSPNNRYML